MINERFFSSASTQAYGIRRDHPVLGPKKASAALRVEIRKYLESAFEYALAHVEGAKPPRVVLRAPASLGKSSSFLQELKSFFDDVRYAEFRVGYFGPTLELCDELREKAAALGIPARVFRGRSAVKPGAQVTGEKMCGKSDVAEMLSAAGYSVADTLCKSKVPTGTKDENGKPEYEKVECPLAATCAYFAQMQNRDPGLILGSHAYLTTPIEALKQEARLDIIIIDESFANEACVQGRRVILDRLLAPKTIPSTARRYQKAILEDDGTQRKPGRGEQKADREADEAEMGFGSAIMNSSITKAMSEKREIRIEDVSEAYTKFVAAGEQTASAFFSELAVLEYARLDKPEIHAGMPIEKQRDLASAIGARNALSFAAFWKRLSKELEGRTEGSMNGIRWKWDELVGKGSEAYVANVAYLYHPKEIKYDRVPVLMLDASANDKIVEQFFPEFEYVTMRVALPDTVKICQVSDRTGSMRMYKESDTRMKEVHAFLERLSKWTYAETHHMADGKDRRPLFIGYKSIHEQHWIDNNMADAWTTAKGERIVESVDRSFSIAHANGVRGVDRWKDTRSIVIGSRMEPSPSAVEGVARAIFANVDYEIGVGAAQYDTVERDLVAKDGQRQTVKVSRHPDELCDLVLRQIREEEMIQCLARSRPIHRKEPLTVFLLSNIPLDGYEPDNLFRWSQVMPDQFDRFALDRANVVIPDHLSDLAVVAGELWPSYDAIKRAHARRSQTAHNLHRLFSHGADGQYLTRFGSNIAAPTHRNISSFNSLNRGNPCGDNIHMESSIDSCPLKDTAPLSGGLVLGHNEARVRFRRAEHRGIRTAVVKFRAGETLEDIGERLLQAFPDAYAVEITGDLSQIAVSHERMIQVSEEIETVAADAALYGDEFWWQLSLDARFRPANDDLPSWMTGKTALRLAG